MTALGARVGRRLPNPDPAVQAPRFVEERRSFEGMAWPPPMDRTLLWTRVSIGVAIFAGLWLWFDDPVLRWPWPVVFALAASTALAIVGVLVSLEHLPAEPQGKVTSKGGPR